VPLVQYIRAHGHPTTPIILTEGTPYGADWSHLNGTGENDLKNVALATEFAKLVAGGDTHLHYTKTVDIFSDDLGMPSVNNMQVDPTVGGTHLTDLGMRKQAAFWAQAIPKIMAAEHHTAPPAPPAPPATSTKGELNLTILLAHFDGIDVAFDGVTERAASDTALKVAPSVEFPHVGWDVMDALVMDSARTSGPKRQTLSEAAFENQYPIRNTTGSHWGKPVRFFFSRQDLHSRMPLDPTHVRLKRTSV
jgi:hypothetical protein